MLTKEKYIHGYHAFPNLLIFYFGICIRSFVLTNLINTYNLPSHTHQVKPNGFGGSGVATYIPGDSNKPLTWNFFLNNFFIGI